MAIDRPRVRDITSPAGLAGLEDWLPVAFRRFGIAGYGRTGTNPMTPDLLTQALASPDRLYAGTLEESASGKGIVVARHSRWEESVVQKPFAKVVFLAADTYEGAHALLSATVGAMRKAGVVLGTGSSGNSPAHIQVAFAAAGFYVGSQALTLCADVEAVWKKLSKLPPCDTCRIATASDADAVGDIASKAFEQSRFTADPFFPRELGNRIYAAWAKKLVLGDEHELVILEQNGRIAGFANVQRDVTKVPEAPGLFVVDRDAQGSGLGPLMLRRVIEIYRERGAEYPLIFSEKSNSGVNTIFFRLGYWIENMNIVYHWTPNSGLVGAQ
jgi:GNAT superfamily N-acetyltransferase